MIRTIRENRLILVVVVASLLNMVGGALGVWMSYQARHENCADVREAFAAYTDALAEVTHADPGRVQQFRDAYEPALAGCH